MNEIERNASLYFSEGASDKEYHAQIKAVDGGLFVVDFQYGRRGSALTSGTKTAAPVDLAKAVKVYEKLVAEKRGKGYVDDVAGTPYQDVASTVESTGLSPQLLNDTPESSLEDLFRDPAWFAQEKMNGERRMARFSASDAMGSNRKGLRTSLPVPVVEEAAELGFCSSEIDGEIIGDTIHVFDLLSHEGRDLRHASSEYRHNSLRALFAGVEIKPHVRLVDRADTEEEKRALFARVKREGGEGVVFKRRHVEYTPGRPNSGGTQLKFKFYAMATVIVLGMNEGKRSANLAVVGDDGIALPIGNVTIPPNASIPADGDLIEVRYLYAYRNGSLYQPTYERSRPDKTQADKLASLKFFGEALADDEKQAA